MKERPIPFSGAMVRALLDGSKTQTRRIVKPQPAAGVRVSPFCSSGLEDGHGRELANPYGAKGDRLYVRETRAQPTTLDPGPTFYRADYPDAVLGKYENLPPAEAITWKPSIHMPRSLSRITLEVTGVRVERLQAMEGQTAFESDALKEGICRIHHGDGDGDGEYGYHAFRNEPHPNNWIDPCDAFHELWDSLNAAHGYGWDENPWVWVVEFRKVES
jgi:hypothetical protein